MTALRLITAPLVIPFLSGCFATAVGRNVPPWPNNLDERVVDHVAASSTIPAGGSVAIAGVWAHERGVYLDILIETDTDEDVNELARACSGSAYAWADARAPWFQLEQLSGERIALLNRKTPTLISFPPWIPIAAYWWGAPQVFGRDGRCCFVVWYRTSEALTPGDYVLRFPPLVAQSATDDRDRLGITALDGMIVTMRPFEERPATRPDYRASGWD